MGNDIYGVTQGYGVGNTSGQTTQTKALDRDAFLTLLVTEMSNQDPLKPMEDKDFIAQLAQFSSLEQMQTLNKNMDSFISGQSMVGAANLIGRTVTAVNPSDGTTLSGKVESVRFEGAQIRITVNNTELPIEDVTNIS